MVHMGFVVDVRDNTVVQDKRRQTCAVFHRFGIALYAIATDGCILPCTIQEYVGVLYAWGNCV